MMPWLSKLVRSFVCALAGLARLLRTQRNARIHAIAATMVVAAGAAFGIDRTEWCIVALASGMVVAAEALNTSLEMLANRITTKKDEGIRRAKDVAAAGVLVTAIAALVIGLIVFLPRVLGRF